MEFRVEIGFIGLGRIGANMVRRLLKSLAPPDGYLLCGPAGAGHLVKMVHNGIEYGMLQQAIDTDVPAPIITLSLLERFCSRRSQDESFSAKVITRNEFGGHETKTNGTTSS